jgi:ribulose-5-phosphate 4-epimerase/fuculose-1-phosphate aldolase
VPFAPSGSDDLQRNVTRAIETHPQCAALLLEEHGLVTLGTTIVSAFYLCDLIEELAQIGWLSETLAPERHGSVDTGALSSPMQSRPIR